MANAIPIFKANNYGYDILWVCFLMSMCSVKLGLKYRMSSCNFIADWTILWERYNYCWLGPTY